MKLLMSAPKAVNKGLKELSKPLKKALHYVIKELSTVEGIN